MNRPTLDLSVAVVNWNTRDLLRDCLRSIFSSNPAVNFEVIVVDNASGDGSQQMVEEEFPQVRVIANTQNLGFARACNQAIDQSTGRHILLLNSDTLIPARTLDASVRFMEVNLEAGVVGVSTVYADSSPQPCCFQFPSLLTELTGQRPVLVRERSLPTGDGTERIVFETDWLAGHYLFVKRDALERIGNLDERFFMYSEETDLCLRLNRGGYKAFYLPYAQVTHHVGQSTKQRREEMKIQLFKSKILFFRKHYGSTQAFLLQSGLRAIFIVKMTAYYLLTRLGLGSIETRLLPTHYWALFRSVVM